MMRAFTRIGIIVLFLFAAPLFLIAFLTRDLPSEEYARLKLPNIEFVDVVADKQSYFSGFGCVYVVVRLPKNSPKSKPSSQHREWLPTPIPRHILHPDDWWNGREECLASSEEYLTGAGLDGYGDEFLRIIANSGAWAQVHGGSESQILKVYAPDENLAMYLRYGD